MTHMPSRDFFNHGEFAEHSRVVERIGRSLATGQALTDRRVGASMGVGMAFDGVIQALQRRGMSNLH